MEQAIYNIPNNESGYLLAGDTYNGFSVTVSEEGSPMDLTGSQIQLQAKNSFGHIVIDLKIGSGITLVDAVNGLVRVDSFPVPNIEANLDYDLQMTFSGGLVRTYLKGKIKIKQDVTE